MMEDADGESVCCVVRGGLTDRTCGPSHCGAIPLAVGSSDVATPGVRLKEIGDDVSTCAAAETLLDNDMFFKDLHQPHEAIERKSLNGEISPAV